MNNDPKTREQYDYFPYLNIPIERMPQKRLHDLFVQDLATSCYLRNGQITPTNGMTILGLGCGNVFKTLQLSQANSDAKVVGIDSSKQSIDTGAAKIAISGSGPLSGDVL